MRMVLYCLIFLIIGTSFLAGCLRTHTKQPSLNRPSIIKAPLVVQEKTLIFQKKLTTKNKAISRPHLLMIPSNMLLIYKIIRSGTPMRQGPRVSLPIYNRILQKNDYVVFFEELGVWRKVLAIRHKQIGWVHHQTIRKSSYPSLFLKLSSSQLPIVMTTKKLHYLYNYPDGRKRNIFIPDGKIFLVLNKKNRRSLLWVAETNSVMWLNSQFLH